MTDELTLLVDAPSLIYRAFFSTPDTVRAPDGTPVNAAHGFLRMMARLIQDHDPDRICCAADENWRPEWRVEIIETYKTHRTEAGSLQQQTDAEVSRQVAIIYGLLALCGIQVIGHPDYEAEDVIGTLTARAPGRVAIVSGDRDLFQLVRDPDVWVLYPKRGVSVVDRVDEGFIQKKFGIPGGAYLDYAVLRGDASDGLPGVRGIGEKIAASLVTKYGSLEAIVEAAADAKRQGVVIQKVRADLDYLRRAVQVVTIATDLPLTEEDLTRPRGDPHESVYSLATGFGLTNAVKGLTDALKSTKSSR
ncbi:MAG: flap endonuclease [Actinobacteria bacterium]|nr:flap endonuclease [Actinomycetota bacterium]